MDAHAAPLYSVEDFRRRAMRQRGPYATSDYGDHRLNPDLRDLIVREGLREAAVLIPVVDRGGEAMVLLTKRAEVLRNHSGQVAFPGGRIDPDDASPEEAALRETMEEIGLDRDFIEIVGRYNPQTEPSTIDLDEDRIKDWLSKGAQPTEPVEKLLKIKGLR